ncbi:MAG: biopolymer transporter ExbD [Planctomycetota bacterium]|nr:biopolymer transporter ExbD [Planctomycetota bacterium]
MKLPAYRGSQGTSINMTPMIDVTFLLIIFFLVSSHIAKQDHRLPLDLPVSDTALGSQVIADRPTTTVHVLPDGSYHLGSNPLPLATIIDAIGQRNANTPGGLRVRIRTDKSVAYEQVSPLLKACANLDIRDVVFSVYEDLRRSSSRNRSSSSVASRTVEPNHAN